MWREYLVGVLIGGVLIAAWKDDWTAGAVGVVGALILARVWFYPRYWRKAG